MTTQQTTAVARSTSQTLPAPILDGIRGIMNNIPALLPPDITLEQFRAGLWLELQQQTNIGECTPQSVASAIVKAANAGLLPGRDCHVISFKNQGRLEATLVPNYQGIILALERSGKVKKAFAHAVHSRDHFEVDYLEDRFSHKPTFGHRGDIVCFYGCILMKDGTRHFEIMTEEQIDSIRRKAPRHDSGPWATHYEEMARKTALKRVAKYIQLSPQQHQLLEEEDARERTDISEDRVAETVTDLYGEPRTVPDFTQQTAGSQCGHLFRTQINAAWTAFGLEEDQIAQYWDKICKRFSVTSPHHLKPSVLPTLLQEVRGWIDKHHTTASPETGADGTLFDWRTALSDAAIHLPETDEHAALHHEIAAALVSSDTPADVWQELVARVQNMMTLPQRTA